MQLSPIQCTYSNIFIRFFKFFPANTNIYQNSYRVPGANCAVEIALSGRQCSLLCLFAPFPHASTKVSCVGFIIWFPSGGLPRVINCAFDQSFHAKSENACLLLVYSFSPRVQSIPRGPRIFARNDKVLRTEGKRMKSIAKTDKVFVWFILCHSEELYSNDVRIPRKGTLS